MEERSLVALMFLFSATLKIVLKETADFTAFCIDVLQLLPLTVHVTLEIDLWLLSEISVSKCSRWVRYSINYCA